MKLIIFLATTVFIASCSSMPTHINSLPFGAEDVFHQLATDETISLLRSEKNCPETFKSIGNITLSDSSRFRIALSGSKPDKLRAVILAAGRPVETFSTDGEFVYMLSHSSPNTFLKKKTGDPSLENILLIPIKTKEVLQFLTGSVPVYPYDDVLLKRNESENGHILELTKGWNRVVEKIFFDNAMDTIYRIETFSSWGNLLYRAEFGSMQSINGYHIPFDVFISNGKGLAVTLTLDQYWADISLLPALFALSPPGQQ